MRYIDLRSDSVTMPTEAMRKAMYEAEAGYDVYGDDRTTIRLEALAAEMTGKEAGLFAATGTMCNQLAILSFTERGDEIILSSDSHIANSETGAVAVLSSVSYHSIFTDDGIIRSSHIESAIRSSDKVTSARTGLLCLENALGRGTVVPLNLMKEAYETAKKYGIPVHTDGARAFNAMHALDTGLMDIAKYTDSLAIHLSKALCAPIGSVLTGSSDFIKKARKYRHMLGGGWSHPGIIAAAGIVALQTMVDRVREDNINAGYMRDRLSRLPDVEVEMKQADINLVFFKLNLPQEKIDALPQYMYNQGVKILNSKKGIFRFVLHNDVSRDDINTVIQILGGYLSP
jgi:threonine aldolase